MNNHDQITIDDNVYFSYNGKWLLFGGPLYDRLEQRRGNSHVVAITADFFMTNISDRWELFKFVDNGRVFVAYSYKDGKLPPEGRYAGLIAKP